MFFDASGRKSLHLQNPERYGNLININTHELSNGVYMYLIITDLGDYTGQLQIQRRGF